jgi:hypothetical protein
MMNRRELWKQNQRDADHCEEAAMLRVQSMFPVHEKMWSLHDMKKCNAGDNRAEREVDCDQNNRDVDSFLKST